MPIMSRRLAFLLQLSIAIGFLAGSSAASPLYAIYQARWGFSPITITIVFAIYAIGVLAALLTLGSLSDHVGRRPVLVVAIISQAIAMLIFATASGVPSLLVARVVQGLSTGAAIGAVGAGMIDLDRMKGTIANAVGPLMGTATGAIASGLMVQYVARTDGDDLSRAVRDLHRTGGRCHLDARDVVVETRRAGLAATAIPPAAGGACGHAASRSLRSSRAGRLPGFYLSLGPTLVHRLVGSSAIALGSLAIFVFAGSGAVPRCWCVATARRA